MSEHDVLQQWLQKAADDLESAAVLLKAGLLANGCYHAQQTGEKALKAYLSLCEEDVPYSHNLSILCKLCAEKDGKFLEILSPASDLTDYAVNTRYPGDDSVSEAEAEDCIQKARQIFMFVQEHLDFPEGAPCST
ncbi:MAG: HEPN domain-containing protein [Oscillospiraceae bacterium]|jgi:HEPN domain-containing protein|nr:HEPN domain-containing protein [Oscillospiraceae bacterium]